MPTICRIGSARRQRMAVMTAPADRLNSRPSRRACCATLGRLAPMYWVMTAVMPEEMTENRIRKMLM